MIVVAAKEGEKRRRKRSVVAANDERNYCFRVYLKLDETIGIGDSRPESVLDRPLSRAGAADCREIAAFPG